MNYPLPLPSPSGPREHHADWVELRVLKVGAVGLSFREVVRDFKMGGVVDSQCDWEEGQDVFLDDDDIGEGIAEAAFAEIYERQKASGNAYPFEVSSERVQLRTGMEKSVYTFLTLLARFGKDAGPPKSYGERIFEEVCTKAIESYLGGAHHDVNAYKFGHPRKTLHKHFPKALNELCSRMGEGLRARTDQPKMADQKDAQLDVVAWRSFSDMREGKLIVFGQCATGADWVEKRTELWDAIDWCSLWMERAPYVRPIKVFCVPHRVELGEWEVTCRKGGILFDRCRIASHVTSLDPDVSDNIAKWTEFVMRRMRA